MDINLEGSWLDFNEGLITLAKMDRKTVEERMKFVSIAKGNLDEFVAVRYRAIMQQDLMGRVKTQYRELGEVYRNVVQLINMYSECKVHSSLSSFRVDDIKPQLVPTEVSLLPEDTPVSDQHMCIIGHYNPANVELTFDLYHMSDVTPVKKWQYDLVGNLHYITSTLDYTTGTNIGSIVLGEMRVITRKDSPILPQELLGTVKRRVIKRDFSRKLTLTDVDNIAIIQFSDSVPTEIIHAIMKDYPDVVYVKTTEALYLDELKKLDKTKLEQHQVKRIDVGSFEGEELHYFPYNDFKIIENLVDDAANHEDVTFIGMTIYRIDKDANIVESLCRASEQGKKVHVFIELTARFDELHNIKILEKLRSSGCKVSTSHSSGKKVHCKFILIERKHMSSILHVSTGNYHADTTKLYSDISLLTTVAGELPWFVKFFDDVKFNTSPSLELTSGDFVTTLMDAIYAESEEPKGDITIKVNSLTDSRVINALKDAADNGTKIRIICRGACGIHAQTNIAVTFILGDYLEHARVFSFKQTNRVFIGSMDLMYRNLSRRIESLVEIQSEKNKNNLRTYLDMNMRDSYNTFRRIPDNRIIPPPFNPASTKEESDVFILIRNWITEV